MSTGAGKMRSQDLQEGNYVSSLTVKEAQMDPVKTNKQPRGLAGDLPNHCAAHISGISNIGLCWFTSF
ncbi:hypothetical protein MGG_16264 [Pyricularia oryzae 70-15]|uniref:Uncharacterized protein n=4 Tax=Pyricularia oryzae TaxID=318829 RepID=G4MQ93_PYRO7|nr:uncharacterized protein MGG_16264 [Pyricularia oryzae 70-15]EHA57286.1 hypothetical protein MGG_16264 [Pyricularia oryzae 70-15]ELQ41315.1 hypothetical protein OOU_Y34scaffold00283g7 [Pyricularia oryzae Y34]KAI7923090.1 hypothetical protein M0657_005268 [Pyricularia oryzae]KAI7925999.1 hypothetical protein M9X92_002955 [Pyricularia oryzae]